MKKYPGLNLTTTDISLFFMRKVHSLLRLSLFISLLIVCSACEDKTLGPPELSWSLEDAYSQAGQDANLKCLIVFKDGHIIKEKYFHPGDSLLVYDVRSVTKSVMATLIGIAIDKNIIPSEDQKIGKYLLPLDKYIDSVKANIKIKDLLSMSSGITGDDLLDIPVYNNWITSPNQVLTVLNEPMHYTPGQTFEYNSPAAHLTSVVLTEASGMSTSQFAKQYLFQPLGIEFHFWQTDNQGFNNGAAGVGLTPHDMLKIGQLYLNKGMYNGVRIVSEEWINKASTFKITTNNVEPFGPGYGYFWWIGNTGSHGYFFSNGYGGQFIVVVPDLNLIVVATNAWSYLPTSTTNQDWYSTISVIINKILPLYE
jgi:CubicO group peptidase (beta-lactamase class C family)